MTLFLEPDRTEREMLVDEAIRLIRLTPSSVLIAYLPVISDFATLPGANGEVQLSLVREDDVRCHVAELP